MEEEIREEKLDSPLVVHKKSDASYQETATEVTMNATHTDDESSDAPTLERHRFRKEKKKKKWPYVLLVLVAIAMVVLCVLIYNDVIPLREKDTTAPQTTKSYTTKQVNEFDGIITVKGTYIFFEGKEIDGIQALEKEIKYLDEGTSFIIQDEKADSNFLNYEVLSLLSLYNIDYDITHVYSSGLKSKYEDMTTTTAPSKASTKTSNKASTKAPTKKTTGD